MLLETTPSVHNRTYQLDQRGGGGRVQANFKTLANFTTLDNFTTLPTLGL